MEKVVQAVARLQLWQLMMAVSAVLLLLGFTGELGVGDTHIVQGQETQAVIIGCVFAVLAVVLRMIPAPNGGSGYKHLSAHQKQFATKFQNWTTYEDATRHKSLLLDDWKLNPEERLRKILQLRIELASYQNLLERKIDDGVHYVRMTDTTE